MGKAVAKYNTERNFAVEMAQDQIRSICAKIGSENAENILKTLEKANTKTINNLTAVLIGVESELRAKDARIAELQSDIATRHVLDIMDAETADKARLAALQ